MEHKIGEFLGILALACCLLCCGGAVVQAVVKFLFNLVDGVINS